MAKVVIWNKETAEKELYQRLHYALDERKDRGYRWEENERTLFNARGGNAVSANVSYSYDSDVPAVDGVDQSNSNIGTNYSFKNLRLIHAQLSANPPSVVPRPTSNDPEDRRRADAADRLIRYALREYKLQEMVDLANLNTLIYGTGFIKTMWDKDSGDILEFDEETGEIEMEGRFSISVPDPWSIYVDPDAACWDDVRFIFEKVTMPYEEAVFRFPEKKELLEANRFETKNQASNYDKTSSSSIDKRHYDVVELYQYWEKGLPTNGYAGRFCWCTRDGMLITPIEKNPERYGDKDSKIKKAVLPFHIFTDIDVPQSVWGKSFIEFGTALQDNLNRLDSVILENIQAHGVARIILPEGAEIQDDSITNSPWDIIKMTGSQPPHFMNPMPLPDGMTMLREQLKLGIDDISGVNESMFGQQSREQSGFSMQYATNQGNMIRRRLFNKYVLFVESIYNRYLSIIQKHWDTPRTIKVLGKEKAFETVDIKGADIQGGYDIVVEYGASLSLDPVTRREEIMTLMPLFEKAGVEARDILRLLKLNELGGLYDRLELAHDRQREIFEEMIAKGLYIAPEELQDHPNMLSFAYYYVMTTEYKYLDKDNKVLVNKHITDREQIAAKTKQAATGMAPGPAPQGPAGALPPVPGPAAPADGQGPVDLAGMLGS